MAARDSSSEDTTNPETNKTTPTKQKKKKLSPDRYYVETVLSERRKKGASEYLIKWEGVYCVVIIHCNNNRIPKKSGNLGTRSEFE